MLIVVALPVLYWVQAHVFLPEQVERWTLSAPGILVEHRWATLVTYQFLHGGWSHALINTVAALAFGPPVARLMGRGLRGAAAFFAFYLLCGVLAGFGYIVLNPHDPNPLVGASGAISGLFGAAVRLLDPRRRPSPLFTPAVFAITAAWVVINAVFGLSNLTPGADGMPVAWQAHIMGFLAGLLLIGPWSRAFARPDFPPSFDVAAVEEPPFESPPQ